ncbi:MAG: immune inhibitor A [Bacteroidetes bacterium]|nr:immune inhibitor A [Bacteroidota bacterium]
MKSKIICFIFLLSVIQSFAQDLKYSKAKVFADEKGLQKIGSLGIPIEGEIKKGFYIISDFSEKEISLMKENNFKIEILVDDVISFYQKRSEASGFSNSTNEKTNSCSSTSSYNTPALYNNGTMGGFYTYEQMLAKLDTLYAHYPNLITQKQAVGATNTIEGRPIYFVKISDNPNLSESEPQVFFNALAHAREPMGMQQQIFFMMYLLENYNSNLEIKNLVDNTEIYFVPCANPDGYKYNQSSNPTGGGMWRKNRRNNGSSFGIDLNRNYGYMWGYDNNGSSNIASDDTYRGTSAFSEPETQLIRDFSNSHQFKISVNFHCYGNYLIYPWGYLASFHTPDQNVFVKYSELMSRDVSFSCGTPSETVGYTGNGDIDDWYYGEHSLRPKVLSFTPEAGEATDGFWPASNRIIDIAKSYIGLNLTAIKLVGRYAELTDKTPSVLTQVNSQFKFYFQRLGLDSPATYTVSILPLSPEIISVGSPKVFSSMSLLQTITDSISLNLNPGIQNGISLKFLVSINNGYFEEKDTILKYFGQGTIVLNDNCNSTSNWTGGWGVSTSQYYSSPSSITDSPTGNYGYNANNSTTLINSIDLTDAITAKLNFYAKWSTEAGFDYVQVKASNDGGSTWTPLCGKYTKAGNSNQAFGEPVYDGSQTSWVQEEMDLDNFIGTNVKLRFTLISDNGVNSDGFYFDDLKVTKMISNSSTIIENENSEEVFVSDAFPNPAESECMIRYDIKGIHQNCELKIFNSLGKLVFLKKLTENRGEISIPLNNFSSGVYFYRINSKENNFSQIKKIVVL